MALLVLGLVLWIFPHLFKRLAPGARARLAARIGERATMALFGLVITVATLLIIIGFRAAPYVAVYTPRGWAVHVNNLLMLVALFLFGASHAPSRVRRYVRNPMLTAVVIWAIAHLLVNGDLAGVVLFGTMGVWALANMALIDASERRPPAGPVPAMAELRLALLSIVAFAAITGLHVWLGRWPFPG